MGHLRARPARQLYRLTRDGRAQLAKETATWRRFAAGVSKLLLAP
jgi:DNA-binding PadR family transcriptional regulator